MIHVYHKERSALIARIGKITMQKETNHSEASQHLDLHEMDVDSSIPATETTAATIICCKTCKNNPIFIL